MSFNSAPRRPFSRLTGRLIAEMQTACFVEAMRLFDGRLDRAAAFLLVLRDSPEFADGDRPINGRKSDGVAARAVAMTFDRPLDAAQQLLEALIASGFCTGGPQGAKLATATLTNPRYTAFATAIHDLMVRLVANLRTFGVAVPEAPGTMTYKPKVTIAAAIDLMLIVYEFVGPQFRSWTEMLVINGIVTANARPITFDTKLAFRYSEAGTPPPRDLRTPVTAAALAVSLRVPRPRVDAIVRRALADGHIERAGDGLLASDEFLTTSYIRVAGERMTMRTVQAMGRLVASGMPLDDLACCYINGKPPLIDFA